MYKYVKRIIDVFLSLVAILILFPMFILIAFLIKLESPGSIFFKQERAGIDQNSFHIYKFRTMRCDAPNDTPTWMLNNPNQYITNIGSILRKLSIDELPQLINILRGEMSLIGPRPVVWNERDLINERENLGAFSVLPGLTGLAQINGRDELDYMEKARFDAEYVKNQTFWFDVKIFFGTILSVLKMDGIVEGMMKPSNISKSNNEVEI